MSRLQVGGLALIIGYDNSPHNLGCVVRLVEFYPVAMFEDGEVKTNAWVVYGEDLIGRDGSTKCPEMIYRQEHLQPLGDDKGIELYGLREEIMTGHDKEAV
ncbi:hypothetical protein ABBZ27_05000 [Acinetobacter baumannii]|uniref:hypothetical protein n=1 Tax=Acinetobacter baumannii TaxID=470 RepID=UPI0002B9661C|nr:hypothetical protein [Acinetobacter baumannii]